MDNNAKNKLKGDIKKKITTTMIGALSAFENGFGKLWAIDKENEEDLTEREKKFNELWLRVREEILDNGNAQIGAILKELDAYLIERKRYEYKFYNGDNNGRN